MPASRRGEVSGAERAFRTENLQCLPGGKMAAVVDSCKVTVRTLNCIMKKQ
jgi:hypothetical protein